MLQARMAKSSMGDGSSLATLSAGRRLGRETYIFCCVVMILSWRLT